MRYELIGKKIPHVGKTLWEILGNLKNFGVGRIVIKSTLLKHPEPSFFKIVKVQPKAPPKNKLLERPVVVWFEQVIRGIRDPKIKKISTNHRPDFQLVPKAEELEYWKKAEECSKKLEKIVVPKYVDWPPLYKELWKSKQKKEALTEKEMPKLNSVITARKRHSRVVQSDSDEVSTPPTSNLYATNVSVEEMIKEIVQLKEIINANKKKT